MARPKKYDSKRLVELTEDYFVNNANGDPCMLKFSNLETFFNKNGLDVKAYNLRRDPELLKRIEELKVSAQTGFEKAAEASYKNLDIEEFIRKSYDLNSLRKALVEMDDYWREVYNKATRVAKDNKRLVSERSSLIKENLTITEDAESLGRQVKELEEEKKQLNAENMYLRGQIKKYIYPAAANVLLERMHLPSDKAADIVNKKAIEGIIDDGKPAAFDGVQKKKVRKMSREEELLAAMKRMVET